MIDRFSDTVMPSKSEIRLHDGRTIALTSLLQSRTYEGLIEGLPTVEMNQRIIDSVIHQAKTQWHDVPLLIEPVGEPIKTSRPYPFGHTVSIPSIQCISRWTSSFESQGDLDGFSSLTVVFFQDSFAMPIAPEIISRIVECDWDRLATFHEI